VEQLIILSLVQLVVPFHLLSLVFPGCAHKRTVYSVPRFVPPGVVHPDRFSLGACLRGQGVPCSSFCPPVARFARPVFVCAARSHARFQTGAVRLKLAHRDFSCRSKLFFFRLDSWVVNLQWMIFSLDSYFCLLQVTVPQFQFCLWAIRSKTHVFIVLMVLP
jgi:hypothetical protein